MNRRTFIASLGGASSIALAGCVDSVLGPNPQVENYVQTDPRMVSVDETATGITGTIQNTGHAGNITGGLYWLHEEDVTTPDNIGGTMPSNIELDSTHTWHFDADEQRDVSFTAEPPEESVAYEILAEPAMYGGVVRNTGGAGEVQVGITFDTPQKLLQHDIEPPSAQTVYLQADEETTVTFDVRIPIGVQYELRTESV